MQDIRPTLLDEDCAYRVCIEAESSSAYAKIIFKKSIDAVDEFSLVTDAATARAIIDQPFDADDVATVGSIQYAEMTREAAQDVLDRCKGAMIRAAEGKKPSFVIDFEPRRCRVSLEVVEKWSLKRPDDIQVSITYDQESVVSSVLLRSDNDLRKYKIAGLVDRNFLSRVESIARYLEVSPSLGPLPLAVFITESHRKLLEDGATKGSYSDRASGVRVSLDLSLVDAGG